MKIWRCFIVSIILSLVVFTGYARTFTNIWYGSGISLHDNYDVGASYGLNFYKAVNYGIGIGFSTFVQQLSLNIGDESNASSGGTIRLNSKYFVFAPTVVVQLGKSGHFSGYLNGGLGVLEDGYTRIHTWSNVAWPIGTSYDDIYTGKDNLSQIIFRLGIGFIQYYYLFGSFHLFVCEDIGILPSSVQKNIYDYPNIANVKGNLNEFFSPTYFSVHLGIAHITNSKKRRY